MDPRSWEIDRNFVACPQSVKVCLYEFADNHKDYYRHIHRNNRRTMIHTVSGTLKCCTEKVRNFKLPHLLNVGKEIITFYFIKLEIFFQNTSVFLFFFVLAPSNTLFRFYVFKCKPKTLNVLIYFMCVFLEAT